MEKLVLKIPTIHCEGCVENIQRALKAKKGIALVEGNSQTKEVTVSYLQEEIGEQKIRESIVQMGHQIG
ncbi:MAG: heavy-metal-associated domain-containing protein [Deltaproteobacteria bacterium]|nr:heavy-metal-associated domain-containing protein [Deltaproteobacteria bacterium]